MEIDKIKNLPFRNYLMEYIVPELNEGLLELSNVLPDDPVEFLVIY
jgi:adenylate kinase